MCIRDRFFTMSIKFFFFSFYLVQTIDTLTTQNIYPQPYPQKQWMNIKPNEQTRILNN